MVLKQDIELVKILTKFQSVQKKPDKTYHITNILI